MKHSCGRSMVATDVAMPPQIRMGWVPAWLCVRCKKWWLCREVR